MSTRIPALILASYATAGCGHNKPAEVLPAEPCVVTLQQVSVTKDRIDNAWIPVLAWNGDGYGVVWQASELFASAASGLFTLLDADGVRTSDVDQTVAPQGTAFSLLYTGDGYALAWGTGSGINFERLEKSGKPIDFPVSVISGIRTPRPALAYSGDGFGIVWGGGGFFALDLAGRVVSPAAAAEYAADDTPAAIVYTGQRYGTAWTGDEPDAAGVAVSGIYFAAYDRKGMPAVSRTRVTGAFRLHSLSHPKLVSTGTGYGLAWTEDTYSPTGTRLFIHFVHLDAGGAADGQEIVFPGNLTGMVVADGMFAIMYTAGDDRSQSLFLARVDAAGKRRVQDVAVVADLATNAPAGVSTIAVDGAYSFVWAAQPPGAEANAAVVVNLGRAVCP